MDEHRLTPYALTVEELLPILWQRQVRAIMVFYLLYSLAVGGVVVWATGMTLSWLSVLPIFVLSLVLHRSVNLPRQVRKLDSLVFASRQVVLSEKGCSWTYENGLHSFVPWPVFRKAETYKGMYLLNLPGGTYLQLPRRALSPDQEHFLVERLRSLGLLRG